MTDKQMVERRGSPFPRRNCMDLWTPVERAIDDARQMVERSGAHVRMTDATNFLGQAMDAVADAFEAGVKQEAVPSSPLHAQVEALKRYSPLIFEEDDGEDEPLGTTHKIAAMARDADGFYVSRKAVLALLKQEAAPPSPSKELVDALVVAAFDEDDDCVQAAPNLKSPWTREQSEAMIALEGDLPVGVGSQLGGESFVLPSVSHDDRAALEKLIAIGPQPLAPDTIVTAVLWWMEKEGFRRAALPSPSPDTVRWLQSMLVVTAYNVWGATLNGTPGGLARFNRLKVPKVGDLVFESSTIHHRDRDADRLGILLSVGNEPVENWPDDEGPNPGDQTWRIKTIDGREYLWTNANFIVIEPHCDVLNAAVPPLKSEAPAPSSPLEKKE